MNLLVVTNNPTRASFRQRIGIYLDFLRTKDINCEVAKLPSGSLARRKLFKQAGKFDGVFLHKKGLNFLDALWLRKYSKKIIYDFDDAIMYNPKAPEANSLSHFIPFRRTVGLANAVIAGNSYLAEHAKRFNPNVEILPTGLDTNAYKQLANPQNDGKIRLVWIGSKSTLRYLTEIGAALEEISSRFDNVILRLICDDFPDLQNITVEKRLWSKESEAMDLATSDIGLAPLPDNRFTKGKCGFKILQYAAAGLPIVASPVGVNTRYIQQGSNGFLAHSDSDWVNHLSQLINEPELRKQMSQNAGQIVQRFDLKILGPDLTRLIRQCIEIS
ncbi:MAG: glycosyltransferase family 4 protein [Planctomycetota bacterium]|nr:MAG: glycosyltransferase family 4 protein [Planctomycetota bacterium]